MGNLGHVAPFSARSRPQALYVVLHRFELECRCIMGPPSPARSPSPSRRKGGGLTYRSTTPAPGLSGSRRLEPLLGSPSRPGSHRSVKLSSPGMLGASDNPYATYTATALQRQRDLLDQEVARLRNAKNTNTKLRGPLPPASHRRGELPGGKTEFGR